MNIEKIISDSISVKEKMLNDNEIISSIGKTVEICVDAFRNNGKFGQCGECR